MRKFVKSKLKWVALVGVVLSAVSLFSHFLLATYSGKSVGEYRASITIFSWRPVFGNPGSSRNAVDLRRLWGTVRPLQSLHPHANPRRNYEAPALKTNGFIFVRVQGGLHDVRNSDAVVVDCLSKYYYLNMSFGQESVIASLFLQISDVVVISRLLNATLVIPEIQSTTSSKGISSDFKSFAYLYNEDQFIAALAKDAIIEKTLPRNLKSARRKKEIPMFKVSHYSSPDFYVTMVLPVLKRHSVVELLVADGGCLQAILPPHLEEYQRLRCRVAFHALQFRQEIHDLANKILTRLRASGRPFLAYDPGMTRDALAYHGCAELFQDVHTQLIQHRRLWMIKRGVLKGGLSVDSVKQHLNGSCPLMPEEVGILLRAFGYSSDTIIYVSGGEIFGGQRALLPLHAMFENVVDRTSLCTSTELRSIYGREKYTIKSQGQEEPKFTKEIKVDTWKTSGSRPRPLPPPPARPKYPYNLEGWWGWIAEADKEPEPTIMESRTNAHKLLWEAIDYVISLEADVFIPGFDRDGKGHPNVASMVMGHRLYQSAALKTFRPDRRQIANMLEEIRDQLYQANRTWVKSVRKHLHQSLLEGLHLALNHSKPLAFLSHPVPECSCVRYGHAPATLQAKSPSRHLTALLSLGVQFHCPAWMDNDTITSLDRENEEELEDDDDSIVEQLFQQTGGSREVARPDLGSKEDIQMEDQDELDSADR